MGRSCTSTEVDSFIRAELPGQVLTYYTADHSYGYDGLDKNLHGRSSPQLVAVVNRIRRLANAGQVDLVQERSGNRTWYRAIWRARAVPLAPEAWLPRLAA